MQRLSGTSEPLTGVAFDQLYNLICACSSKGLPSHLGILGIKLERDDFTILLALYSVGPSQGREADKGSNLEN